MNKCKILYKKIIDNPMGFALFLSIINLFLGTLFFRPFFEENDDLSLAMIAEGAFGKRDYHLVYCNVILGKIVSLLSSLIQGVRWHTVIQYFFVFAAMVAITYVLSHYRNGRVISVIVQLALLYEIYVSFQYTKNAVFVSAVGIVLILHHLHLKYASSSRLSDYFTVKGRRGALIAGYILVFYGMMLRNSGFIIAVTFCIIPAFCDFLIDIKKSGIKKLGSYTSYILPVFALLGIITLIDKAVYNLDPEWKYYNQYNEARTAVTDYKYYILDYDKYGEQLSEIGVSSNDAYMYLTYQFGDESVATPELYNQIISLDRGKSVDVDFLKAWVADVYNTLFVFSPLIIAFMAVVLLYLITSNLGSLGFFMILCEVILYLVTSLYFEYSGRWSHRLVISSVIATFVVLIVFYGLWGDDFYVAKNGKKNRSLGNDAMTFAALAGMVIVALVGHRLENEFDYQEYLRSGSDFGVLQMYMEEEKDTLFVADTFTTGQKYKYSVFSPMKVASLDNYVTTGSWMSGTPIARDVAEKYGYYNPFDALKRGDDVVLIDNNSPDRKAIFLSEHSYGPRYAAEYVETICGYNLYRVR